MSGTPLSDGHFNKCFDSMQRGGENFRSTIYAFVLIFVGLLMWSLNAYIYPAEQNRIAPLQDQTARVINCLRLAAGQKESNARQPGFEQALQSAASRNQLPGTVHPTSPGTSFPNPECKEALGSSLYYRIFVSDNGPIRSAKAPLTPDVFQSGKYQNDTLPIDLRKIEDTDLSIYQHQIEHQFDKAANIAEFHVPLIGIVSDRSWLWMIDCALGLFFYQIIKDQLINLCHLLGFLSSHVQDQPERAILLATSQIVTSSSPRGTQRSWTKLPIIAVVLSLPIITSILLIYDWYYLLTDWTKESSSSVELWNLRINDVFLKDPEFYGGLFAFLVLGLELWLFSDIFRLLRRLSSQHQRLQGALDPGFKFRARHPAQT